MLNSVFSHVEHAPLVFNVLLANPELASKRSFQHATVLGATDCMLPAATYQLVEKDCNALVYALTFPGDKILPLSVPVARDKLLSLYSLLLTVDVDTDTFIAAVGDASTVEDITAVAKGLPTRPTLELAA